MRRLPFFIALALLSGSDSGAWTGAPETPDLIAADVRCEDARALLRARETLLVAWKAGDRPVRVYADRQCLGFEEESRGVFPFAGGRFCELGFRGDCRPDPRYQTGF